MTLGQTQHAAPGTQAESQSTLAADQDSSPGSSSYLATGLERTETPAGDRAPDPASLSWEKQEGAP